MPKKFELNKFQKDAIEYIEWLIDPELVGTGRTEVLARAYLNIAFRNPKKEYLVIDHPALGFETFRRNWCFERIKEINRKRKFNWV